MQENKYKTLASNTLIFAIGNFGSKLIMFFFLPLYTNVLSTGEYGIAELVTTFSSLFVPIISLSIGNAVLRFGLDKNNSSKSVIQNAFLVNTIGSLFLICCIPLLSLYKPIRQYETQLALISILTAFRVSFQYYAKAINRNKLFAADSIINTLVLAISNVVLLVVLKKGISGYLNSQIISLVISVLFLFFYNSIGSAVIADRINKELLINMLKFSIPMVLNALSWWILHSTDKIMLEHYMTENEVGIYTVASKIPSLINTVTFFFSEAWFIAAISDYDSDRDKSFYERTFRVYNAILCLIVANILLVLKPFMYIYVGKDFHSSWSFVPLLLIATLFRNYSDFFGAIITSAKNTLNMMLTSATGACINVIVNALLIPRIGIQGAVLGTTISYVIIGILRMIHSRRIMTFRLYPLPLFGSLLILLFQCVLTIVGWYSIPASVCSIIMIIVLNWSVICLIWKSIRKKLLAVIRK